MTNKGARIVGDLFTAFHGRSHILPLRYPGNGARGQAARHRRLHRQGPTAADEGHRRLFAVGEIY